ncbi:hypothetical protein FQN53_009424 [Emmonsiellopsis sp. PD_33]|nr:hypothetical protein FQN53_009424 [Emmonsiellopsis sp. PD_33]
MARVPSVTRQQAASARRASRPDLNWIPCARCLPHIGKLPPSPDRERLINLRGLIYYGKLLGRRLRKEKRELRDLVRKMDAPRRAARHASAKHAAAVSAAVRRDRRDRRDRRARSVESREEEGGDWDSGTWVEEEEEEEEENWQ